MGQLKVIICRVDEADENKLTELKSFDIPDIAVGELKAETGLDDLEKSTHQIGQHIVRHLLQRRWEEIDEALTKEKRQVFSPRAGHP